MENWKIVEVSLASFSRKCENFPIEFCDFQWETQKSKNEKNLRKISKNWKTVFLVFIQQKTLIFHRFQKLFYLITKIIHKFPSFHPLTSHLLHRLPTHVPLIILSNSIPRNCVYTSRRSGRSSHPQHGFKT